MQSNPLFEALDQCFAEDEATPLKNRSKNPHDSLFRAVFQYPEHAEGLIRHLLPAQCLSAFNFNSLKLQPTSFIDEQLKNLYADLLYSIELDGRPAFIYFLLEHMSSDSPWLAARMLGYEIRIWEKFIEENPNSKILPLILPLVVRHGLTENTAEPTRFEDLYDAPHPLFEILREHSVRLTLLVEDLKREANEDLYKRAALTQVAKLVLMALKNSRSILDLIQSAPLWCNLIHDVISAGNGWMALARVCRYFWMTQTAENARPLLDEISKRLPMHQTRKDVGMNIEEYLLDKGRKQGIELGRHQSVQRVLITLLQQRFGPLPEATIARVKNSDVEKVEAWLERVLGAISIDDVFR